MMRLSKKYQLPCPDAAESRGRAETRLRRKKIILISVVFLLLQQVCVAQIVTTIAGNGISGYTGDGGPATAAQLYRLVFGVAKDAKGNLYICSNDTCRIRKLDPAGIITTFAGSGRSGYSGDGG